MTGKRQAAHAGMNSYENYLFYKTILEIIAKGNKGRKEIAKGLGMHPTHVDYPLRLLVDCKAIEIERYESLTSGNKRPIYKLRELK